MPMPKTIYFNMLHHYDLVLDLTEEEKKKEKYRNELIIIFRRIE